MKITILGFFARLVSHLLVFFLVLDGLRGYSTISGCGCNCNCTPSWQQGTIYIDTNTRRRRLLKSSPHTTTRPPPLPMGEPRSSLYQ